MEPFIVSNDLLHEPSALRERAERDGYLFMKGLVNQDDILETRRDMAQILLEFGWIAPGTDLLEAITHRPAALHGDEEHQPVYERIQLLESFHSLAHDQAVSDLMTSLLGSDVMLHPANIARVVFPSATEHTTPAHQDFFHIQGNPDVWTAWIPLGACPQSHGGLSVLAGSHRVGILPVAPSLGAGGVKTLTQGVEGEWVSSPFEMGDTLFFHSHTVHRGLPNRSGDRLRLSVDYRYQRATDPIADYVLVPHGVQLTWEEIYRDWKSDKYQYYWHAHDLTPVPREPLTVVDEETREPLREQ